MHAMIVHQIQNAPNGRKAESDPHDIDIQKSTVETVDLKTAETVSRDKFVVGYTSQGLPFMIQARRYDDSDNLAFQFIDQHVIPGLYELAQQLTVAVDAKVVIQTFIKGIDALLAEHASTAELTLCVAVVHEKADGYQCAGFSIGDHGIVLKNIDGLSQLAYGTEILAHQGDWVHDRFRGRKENDPSINVIMERNHIFTNVKVENGDELCGYSHLFPDLMVMEERDSGLFKTRCLEMKRQAFTIDLKQSFFNILKHACWERGSDLNNRVETAEIPPLKREITIGRVCIPTQDIQRKLSRAVAINDATILHEKSVDEIRTRLMNTIASSQLRFRLPKKHTFNLFWTGVKILGHSERVDCLLDAFRDVPTIGASLVLIQHQLSFYDKTWPLPRLPLPAWLNPNIRDRLEQAFHREPHKGWGGYFDLLNLLQQILEGGYPDVPVEGQDIQPTYNH